MALNQGEFREFHPLVTAKAPTGSHGNGGGSQDCPEEARSHHGGDRAPFDGLRLIRGFLERREPGEAQKNQKRDPFAVVPEEGRPIAQPAKTGARFLSPSEKAKCVIPGENSGEASKCEDGSPARAKEGKPNDYLGGNGR